MAETWKRCGHLRTAENTCGVSARQPGGKCRRCFIAYHAAYRVAHREEDAAYRAANREKAKAYCAARYAEHRDERRAYRAVYYVAHREECNARNAVYRTTLNGALAIIRSQAARRGTR